MTYDRTPLGIEAIPPAPIFSHLYTRKRQQSWAQRHERLLIVLSCIAACALGAWGANQ